MIPAQVLVVMGVSGSGKTTIGTLLAKRLGWLYAEADDFHPAANIAKMRAGHPLTDDDRWPWLRAIGAWIDERIAAGAGGVVSCSALKRVYRDLLESGRPQVHPVFLHGSRELIERRLAHREGHFFPAKLLDSQFAALHEPDPDERVLTVDIGGTPEQIVAEIVRHLERATAS